MEYTAGLQKLGPDLRHGVRTWSWVTKKNKRVELGLRNLDTLVGFQNLGPDLKNGIRT